MTQRQHIIALVALYNGLSAYQIAKRIGLDVASVSSLLKRMVDKGVLRRVPKTGPRGGYTYYVK